ncbi:MAG: FkbM family methyltransferase [Solirubrobacteraceae bacterium]
MSGVADITRESSPEARAQGQSPLGRSSDGMLESVQQLRYAEETAEPLRTVRLGQRITSRRWPRQLEWLRTASKKIAWTTVEARLVSSPVRYALRELTTRRCGDYALRDGTGRFSVRHRSGDIDILRKFYAYHYYDLPEEVQARLHSLGRAVDVLDLGANIGLFEVFTRGLLPIGRVVCFEPDPANAAVLERTRTANGADWEIVQACASNRDGRARFNTGRKNFSRIGSGGDTDVAVMDVFDHISAADLVKMNIEGSEWDILHDPRLAGTSASWIVEYHRISSPHPDIHSLVRRLFERAGYTTRLAAKTEDNGLLWAWKR